MKAEKIFNLLLSLATLLLTLFVLEFLVGRLFISQIPLKFQFALPDAMRVLAQSSKQARLPEHYIAITGDSYAYGNGDWLLTADVNTNPAFHSAHVLQALSGRDVISFGKPGASTLKGWVREPVSRLQFIQQHIDADFPQPALLLAYFHAGNDLTDNVIQLREQFLPDFGDPATADAARWQAFFDKQIDRNPLGPHGKAKINAGWFTVALFELVKEELKPAEAKEKPAEYPSLTLVRTHGETRTLPGRQSPGMELDAAQTETAFLGVEQSLHYMKQYFPDIPLVVVYVPSVLESYEVVSDVVSIDDNMAIFDGNFEPRTLPASALAEYSDSTAQRLQALTEAAGLYFIDTRADIRTASREQMLHGPLDAVHFNEAGYRVLAASIFRQLNEKGLLP